MIDFLTAMTGLDFMFILIWIAMVALGIAKGIVRQVTILGAIVISAIASPALARPLSGWTGGLAGITPAQAIPLTYTAIFLPLTALMIFLAYRNYRHTKLARWPLVDGIGGAVAGFLLGLTIVAQLTGVILVATDISWPEFDGTRIYLRYQLQSTPFLPLVFETFPVLSQAVKDWLPISIEGACERCL